jgi:hypothetical protein
LSFAIRDGDVGQVEALLAVGARIQKGDVHTPASFWNGTKGSNEDVTLNS